MAESLTRPVLQDRDLLAPQQSELKRIVSAFLLSKIATLGAIIFALFLLIALLAPILVPHDPALQDLKRRLAPPIGLGMEKASLEFPLGNDNLGRDILSRLLVGSRVSLIVGVSTILLASSVGSLIGAMAGFYRGLLDNVVMRIVDVWMAFPSLLLAIAFGAALGPGLANLVLALSLTIWVVYCRVVRAEVLSIRERDYVLAARAMGASDLRIILRHILPNVLAPILVISTLQMGIVIISEASLNFLGVGVQSSVPTWGGMLSDGREFMRDAWWLATFPGIAISIVVLGVNLLGDGLRDALDPRLRRR
ncbi:MAG: ABC transporter permease [Anaerolineales bacterium]|nr:MAG: ABC transporter permease [Anaerolineales bacterium]